MIVDLKSLLTENPEHSPQSVAQNAQKCGVLPQERRDQNILKGPTLDQAFSNFSDITRGPRMPTRQQKKHGEVQAPRLRLLAEISNFSRRGSLKAYSGPSRRSIEQA